MASQSARPEHLEDDRCGSVEIDTDGIKTGVCIRSRDEPDGYPFTGQVVPGMEVT